jgi:hypothetical protein
MPPPLQYCSDCTARIRVLFGRSHGTAAAAAARVPHLEHTGKKGSSFKGRGLK